MLALHDTPVEWVAFAFSVAGWVAGWWEAHACCVDVAWARRHGDPVDVLIAKADRRGSWVRQLVMGVFIGLTALLLASRRNPDIPWPADEMMLVGVVLATGALLWHTIALRHERRTLRAMSVVEFGGDPESRTPAKDRRPLSA